MRKPKLIKSKTSEKFLRNIILIFKFTNVMYKGDAIPMFRYSIPFLRSKLAQIVNF